MKSSCLLGILFFCFGCNAQTSGASISNCDFQEGTVFVGEFVSVQFLDSCQIAAFNSEGEIKISGESNPTLNKIDNMSAASPEISPDNNAIAYVKDKNLFVFDINSNVSKKVTSHSKVLPSRVVWINNKEIAFSENTRPGQHSIVVVDMDDMKMKPLVSTPGYNQVQDIDRLTSRVFFTRTTNSSPAHPTYHFILLDHSQVKATQLSISGMVSEGSLRAVKEDNVVFISAMESIGPNSHIGFYKYDIDRQQLCSATRPEEGNSEIFDISEDGHWLVYLFLGADGVTKVIVKNIASVNCK